MCITQSLLFNPILEAVITVYPKKQLLWSLRYEINEMNKGNLIYSFLCQSEETQSHIFAHCRPILSRISYPMNVNLDDIYGSIDDQVRAIKSLIKIDHIRKTIKEDILPGGSTARTHLDI